MEHRETNGQRREYLAALYSWWLSLIPWDIPVLKPYEAETKAAQPFGIGGRLYTEKAFCRRLQSETNKLLERAKRDVAKATDQPAILAALYEVRNNNANALRYWEKREALEPDTMTETDRHPLTLGDMEAANRKARERVEFIKKCERAGVEVVTVPGAALEKSVTGIVAAWIDDNIRYLESMQVQPRRAGAFEVRQTAEICALVYILDKKATGQDIPGKTALENDITSNYPQFKRAANSIYKETGRMSGNPTKQDCRQYAGKEWRQVVLSLSSHTDQLKQYIENEMIEK